jgi:peptide/nickel transport system ATP-binding protein
MLLASATDDEQSGPAAAPGASATHAGCVFVARCPHKIGPVCDTLAPPVRALSATHTIACHLDIMSAVLHRPGGLAAAQAAR